MASPGLIVGAFFIGIAAILVLITLHELGHFIIAKLCHAYVYEFSIGYGPRLYTHKGKETWFSIRLFPLGGFCSIASDRSEPPKGREEDAEKVPDDRKMDYIARWKKALFILGGPVMNFVIAIIMISIILMATLRLPEDMKFNGNSLDKDKIAYKLVSESLQNNAEAKQYDPKMVSNFAKNTQKISITGWEVVAAKDVNDLNTNKDKLTLNNISVKQTEDKKYVLDNDGKFAGTDVKLIYSNLLNNGWTDQWKDKYLDEFTAAMKDKFKDYKWLVDTNHLDTLVAPDYSTIVYNFLDNFKCDEMVVKDKDFHSYIRLSYRIMNKDLSTGKYATSKDYVTNFSNDKDIVFKANKKNTTAIGINPPSRYFKNTTKAYAYSWKVMGQDSIAILKAFALLFTGHINALAGPVGVASQTATLITRPESFFLYVAGLSANLFVLNLIPVPPLDGYKWWENIIEQILGREIKQKTKYWLYGIGIAVFLIIFIVVAITDLVIPK